MEEKFASSSTVSPIGNVRFNEYKLQQIETENMQPSAAVETKENEKPLLMDDISSFLETMHSKNLTLKKLAKVQNSKLDSLRKENESIRLDNQKKDLRIEQLEMEVETLRSELHTLRHELREDETNEYLKYDLDCVQSNADIQSDTDGDKTDIWDDQIDYKSINNEMDNGNHSGKVTGGSYISENSKDSSDESLNEIEMGLNISQPEQTRQENKNQLTGLFNQTKEARQPQKRNSSLSYLYSWSYLALKQAVFVSLETNTWS